MATKSESKAKQDSKPNPLHSRDVAADEINEDPSGPLEALGADPVEAYARGLEFAAAICESRFAGLIGNMCATAIREEKAAIIAAARDASQQEGVVGQ